MNAATETCEGCGQEKANVRTCCFKPGWKRLCPTCYVNGVSGHVCGAGRLGQVDDDQ